MYEQVVEVVELLLLILKLFFFRWSNGFKKEVYQGVCFEFK